MQGLGLKVRLTARNDQSDSQGGGNMPLTSQTQDSLARRLLDADSSGQLIPALSIDCKGLTFDDAYGIQAAIAAMKEAAGTKQLGWKLAFTNPTVQARYGFKEPGRGYLFQSAMASGEILAEPGRGFLAEPEISFVISEDLAGSDMTPEQVLAATKEVCASIEVASSRYGGNAMPVDLLADNVGAAYIVLSGTRLPPDAIGDLSGIDVEFYKNGELVHTGSGRDVLGNPANAVAWLVQSLARAGLGLKAGQVILSGSLTLPVPASAGDTIKARFRDLGDIEVHIA